LFNFGNFYLGDEESSNQKEKTVPKLPNPFESGPSSNTHSASSEILEKSVFVNPYVAADNAKEALLEKHVKMISTDVRTVNGKKICWNYRMKKCRFGHKCKFAHDSDLQVPVPSDIVTENKFGVFPATETFIQDAVEPPDKRSKKRPGLSQGIEPSNKVMKLYYSSKKQSGF